MTTAIHATEASTYGMAMNLAPTLTLPIPLPHQQSSMAPHFNSKTPSTLGTYLSDYESLVKAAQLIPEEHLARSTHYLNGEDKEDWENLLEVEAMPPNWILFKEAFFQEYPKARKPFISSADLDTYVEKKSSQEIHSLDEYATFHREFRRLAT